MEYKNGYVYDLMDKGGPTKVTEPCRTETSAALKGRTEIK